jgi:hypothetical protein
MARVCSTARVIRDGEETEDVQTTEAEEADIEEENADEEEDYNTLVPSKPSHLDFENLLSLRPMCRR